MSDKNSSLVVSAVELSLLKPEPVVWVVKDLIRIGRKRPSLLASKPHGGKSTLSRQLAVAVVKGRPFLGRATRRSEVLLWQSEDDLVDVWADLQRLGYNPSTDEMIWVFKGDADKNDFKSLRVALDLHPKVEFVIIETLDSLFRIKDIKENSRARESFDKFDKIIGDDFHHRVAFLILCHLKKRDTDCTGDALLGATEIRGRTDAKIYLRVRSDDDTRRIIHTEVRKGEDIPPTILDFDIPTQTSTLGLTVAAERKLGAVKTADKVKLDIVKFFEAHPDATFDGDCFPFVDGTHNRNHDTFVHGRGTASRRSSGVFQDVWWAIGNNGNRSCRVSD
jgi:hypothetical protein